jgi:hypothetical protein
MTNCLFDSRKFSMLCGLLIFVAAPERGVGQAPVAAVAGFNAYVGGVEGRLGLQHSSASAFLTPEDTGRVRGGDVVIDQVAPAAGLPGALLHHWRGTAFVAGAKAADFERLLKDFKAYPKDFAPQVLEAKVLAQDGDRLRGWMRVRQKHVITVVMDTTFDVTFGRLDERHGYSASRSTQIFEVDSKGRELGESEEHGFLWRLNTYWTYEERDGGLYLQIETVSLTRSVPAGLGWVVGPFVESIPRESLEFTLRSAVKALGRTR